jgi:ADP-ribose pyrophosphatase YjhB (NUDIX family)
MRNTPSEPSVAADGEYVHFHDADLDWRMAWHAPDSALPSGKDHGAAAVCFAASGEVVVVSADGGGTWGLPGGRPEPGEDARATLERELREEACADVAEANLLGFIRGECLQGRERGLVLVRSLWSAVVTLQPWSPQHEITHRRLVSADSALEVIALPNGVQPIYRRWLHDALVARDALRSDRQPWRVLPPRNRAT